MANQKNLPRNKKLNNKGQGNKKNGSNFYGGMGGWKGVNKRKVDRLVGGQIRRGINDLNKEKRGINNEKRRAVRDARDLHERTTGDLQHIYGETGDYIAEQNRLQAEHYERSRQQQAAAAQALQQQMGQTTNQNAELAQAELSRLGLNSGGALGTMYADAANAQNLAAQSDANAASTRQSMSDSSRGLGDLLLGMNAGGLTSAMGRAQNDRSRAITDARVGAAEQLRELRAQKRDIRRQRPDLSLQLMQQLQETGWNQYMGWQQLQLQREQLKKANSSGSYGGYSSYSSGGDSYSSSSGSSSSSSGGSSSYQDSYKPANDKLLEIIRGLG